eukprot:592418-Karenia_brevis.AAC.1
MRATDPDAKKVLKKEPEAREVFCWHQIGEHWKILGGPDRRVFANLTRLGPGMAQASSCSRPLLFST